MFHRNDYNLVMYLYTRGAVVYAGDHNGTVVNDVVYKGVPCIRAMFRNDCDHHTFLTHQTS